MRSIKEHATLLQESLDGEHDTKLYGFLDKVCANERDQTVEACVFWVTCGPERNVTKTYTFSRGDWLAGATFVHRIALDWTDDT